LDYAAVSAVMRMLGVIDVRDTFDRLRMFERGALSAMRGIPLETLFEVD